MLEDKMMEQSRQSTLVLFFSRYLDVACWESGSGYVWTTELRSFLKTPALDFLWTGYMFLLTSQLVWVDSYLSLVSVVAVGPCGKAPGC